MSNIFKSLLLLCLWLPTLLVASNLASPQIKKEEKDRQVINDVILGLHTLPANATPWDLLKAQVQADFAPFLIIIPKPVKRFIAAKAVILFDQFRRIVEGPATPMIRAGGKIMGVLGSLLEYVGKDIQKLSKAMMMFGDDENKNKNDRNRNAQSTHAEGIPPTIEIENTGNRNDELVAQMQSHGRQKISTTDSETIQSKVSGDHVTHDPYEFEDDLIDYVIDIDENSKESEIQAYRKSGSSRDSSDGAHSASGRHNKEPASSIRTKEEEDEEEVVFYPPEDAYEGEGELIEI